MKKSILFIPIIFICLSLVEKASAQDENINIIGVSELRELLEEGKNDIILMNFWATWCKPCIKELPYFLAAEKEFSTIKFLYMNLDFSEQSEKVKRFANKKGISPSSIYLIDNVDYNSWINYVSPEWSGAIPATLLLVNGKKYFYEKEFKAGELKELLQTKL